MATDNLKRVMDEVRSILIKNDLAAVVVLQDRDDMEYLYKLDATWNCITMLNDGIQIKAAAATGPHSEKEKLRLGVGVALGFHSFGETMARDMMSVTKVFTSHGIEVTQTLRRK